MNAEQFEAFYKFSNFIKNTYITKLSEHNTKTIFDNNHNSFVRQQFVAAVNNHNRRNDHRWNLVFGKNVDLNGDDILPNFADLICDIEGKKLVIFILNTL